MTPPKQPDKLSKDSVVTIAASLITFAAAVIGLQIAVKPWFYVLIPGILLPIFLLPWIFRGLIFLRNKSRDRKRNMQVVEEVIRLGERLQEQMKLGYSDSIADRLFQLGSQVYGNWYMPNPSGKSMGIVSLLETFHVLTSNTPALINGLRAFDRAFEEYHDVYIVAATFKARDDIKLVHQHQLEGIKQHMPRYTTLVDSYKQFANETNKKLSIEEPKLGQWCYRLPVPLG